ncbi:MAG: transglycosylase domain-containing protein [Collinsella sp.]
MGPRQRQGRSRSKTHVLPMILLSFLGFLLIASVAFGIGMIGNVNRWLSDLPDYTDANAYLVSEPTEIVDCNGNKIASFYTQNRKSITKDQVSPYVLQGTVDVEDERFYEHGGIDLWGIARASVATSPAATRAHRPSPSSWFATPSCRRNNSTRPSSVRCARPISPSRWRICTPRTRSS